MKSFPSSFLAAFVLACAPLSLAHAQNETPADVAKSVEAYEIGMSRVAIVAAEESLRKMTPAERLQVEQALLPLLANPQTPFGGKDLICRWLTWMGSPASVPALEKLAVDPKLGNSAVYALIHIDGPEANTSLIQIATGSDAPARSAAIGALGRRQADSAVAKLSEIASGTTADASAALTALGDIGSVAALQALQKIKASDKADILRRWALLNGAFRAFHTSPKTAGDTALAIFRDQLTSAPLAVQRVTSAGGLIAVQGNASLGTLLPLLKDPNADVAMGVARLIAKIPGTESVKAIGAELPKIDPFLQIEILRALASREPAEVRGLLQENLGNIDAAVRTAAIESLGKVGDASSVTALLPILAKGDADSAIAATALSEIPGMEATKALQSALAGQQGKTKAALLQILGNRADRSSFALVLESTSDADEDIRAAGFQALVRLAKAEDLPKIVALMPSVKSDRDQKAWGQAMLGTARSTVAAGADSSIAAVKNVLPTAKGEQRKTLLLTLVSINTPAALNVLSGLLESTDADQRKECIRALSNPDAPEGAPLLIKAAEKAQDASERILALRGYLDTVRNVRDKAVKVSSYAAAWPLAERDEEKEVILTELGKVDSDDAKKLLKKIKPQTVVALDSGGELKPVDALTSETGITAGDRVLDNWNGKDSTVTWKFIVKNSGNYTVTAFQSHEGDTDAEYSITVNEKALNAKVLSTKDWNDFKAVDVGQVQLEKDVPYVLQIKPTKLSGYLMNLSKVELKSN